MMQTKILGGSRFEYGKHGNRGKNELSDFYRDWFGPYGGREILLTYDNDRRDRLFIRSAEELEDYVSLCRVMGAPAYVSVQPFQERDRPLGLEKLFF